MSILVPSLSDISNPIRRALESERTRMMRAKYHHMMQLLVLEEWDTNGQFLVYTCVCIILYVYIICYRNSSDVDDDDFGWNHLVDNDPDNDEGNGRLSNFNVPATATVDTENKFSMEMMCRSSSMGCTEMESWKL